MMGSQMNWDGNAQGHVKVRTSALPLAPSIPTSALDLQHQPSIIYLDEMGEFTPKDSLKPLAFKNTFKLVFQEDAVSFHHERFGQAHAVWLFDLIAQDKDHLISKEAHQCGNDQYFVTVTMAAQSVTMHWKITGPRKNEALDYHYF